MPRGSSLLLASRKHGCLLLSQQKRVFPLLTSQQQHAFETKKNLGFG
jgi:hypothetical protein